MTIGECYSFFSRFHFNVYTLEIFLSTPQQPPTAVVQLNKELLNRLFPNCGEPHHESEAKCQAFHMKISNLHNNDFALSLAVITRFTATRK